jgi:hypothetical protein
MSFNFWTNAKARRETDLLAIQWRSPRRGFFGKFPAWEN